MSKSSLSTVVSGIVRASSGTSTPSMITDEDLDKAVAELILKEAKQKAERYLKEGVGAYLPDPDLDANLPRANKRFLSAIIRSTDDHNKAVLQAQVEAAREVRAERSGKERRARGETSSKEEGERLRRLMGGSTRRRREESNVPERDRNRRHRNSERRSEDDIYEHSRSSRKRTSRSRSKSPYDRQEGSSSRRTRNHDSRDKERTRRRGDRSRSRSSDDDHYSSKPKSGRSKGRSLHHSKDAPQPDDADAKDRRYSLSQSPPSQLDVHRERVTTSSAKSLLSTTTMVEGSLASSRRHSPSLSKAVFPSPVQPTPLDQPSSRKKARESPTLSEEEDIERLRPRRRARKSPEPSGLHSLSDSPGPAASKMDKYFENSYDPRLDIEPMTIPTVPSTGLIDGTEFERWEAMLDVIRQRREDKLERKRLEKQGLLPKKDKDKKVLKGEMASSSAWDGGETGLMDIQYNKRGAVREWDMGKEGF